MTVMNTMPAYNLKVIVAETGIKPDTLRAWERRYGLPNPQRTKGKHRLYSQHDLELIKWLIARQSEGLSISRAVKLWKQLEEDGQNPLLVYAEVATEQTAVYPPVTGNRIDELRQSWIDACYQFDEAGSEQALAQAFAIYPPETVCLQVLMQGLAAIGKQWYEGSVSVQQEHFASALAMRRLHTLLSAAPPPTRRERIIIACPPQEDHTFAPLLIALMLRYRGWDVVYLGADVPVERLESTLDTIRPNLILLTAQQLYTAASLLDIANFLREQKVTVAFGGLIFNILPDLHKRIPGHFLGARLEDITHVVENLINYGSPADEPLPISDTYRLAGLYFRQQQSQIEAHIWQQFQQAGIPYEHFTNANMHMARNILSALTLGDMAYIGVELVWIKQLLANHRWPDGALEQYLAVYHEAVASLADESVQPIVDWLAKIIKNRQI